MTNNNTSNHYQSKQMKNKNQSVRDRFRKSITKDQIGKNNIHNNNYYYTQQNTLNLKTLSDSSSKSFKFNNLTITQYLKSQNSKQFKKKNLQAQLKQSHQIYKQKNMQKVKQYFSQGNYQQTLLITQKLLNSASNDLQILYISAMCYLNIGNYKKSLKNLNKIILIDQKYNQTAYILAAICQNKLNINNNGRVKLQKCITLFPDYYEALIYLGKLDYQVKKYKQAIQHLKKAINIHPQKIQPLINLSSCYSGLKQYQKCGQVYLKIINILKNQKKQLQLSNKNNESLQESLKKIEQIKFYYRKLIIVNIQYLHKYQNAILYCKDYIEYCKIYFKTNSNLPKKNKYPNPQIYYLLAFAQFKQQKFSQASMTLQQLVNINGDFFNQQQIYKQQIKEQQKYFSRIQTQQIKSASEYFIQSVCLLVSMKIILSDFYQASHFLQRIDHLNISQDISSQKQINFFKKFCEGVVCLMKRKIDDGVNMLQSIRTYINSKGDYLYDSFKKLQNPYQKKKTTTSHYQSNSPQNQNIKIRGWIKFEMFDIVKKIYHMYTAYGYFCKSNFKKCKQEIHKQFSINQDQKLFQSLNYNLQLTQGILQFKINKYKQAILKFQKASLRYSKKPEPYLYIFISKAKIYFKLLSQIDSKKDFFLLSLEQRQKIQQKEILQQQMMIALDKCCESAKQMNNNCGANMFYHRSLYFSHLKKWSRALQDIDQAIQRAQQNYWKYYYVRGLIMACCHSFKQASNQLSVAITLNQKFANAYLIRSKCLQIDGDGNQAFLDLQSYIAFKPQDQQIHKYAGHLLFQNGAFQDAILAYSHGQIQKIKQNYDVFLTRSKTFFLIGKFQQAKNDMKIASMFKSQSSELDFDYNVLSILCQLRKSLIILSQIKNNNLQEKQSKVLDQKSNLLKIKLKLTQLFEQNGQKNDFKYGKIFKPIQQNLFNATIQFYLENYQESIKQFKQCIKSKQLSLIDKSNPFINLKNESGINIKKAQFYQQASLKNHQNNKDAERQQYQKQNQENHQNHQNNQNQSQYQQQENQKRIYVNQMFFNLSICYMMLKKYQQAQKILQKCNIFPQSKIYQQYYKFKLLLRGQIDIYQLRRLNQSVKQKIDLNIKNLQQQESYFEEGLTDLELKSKESQLSVIIKKNSQRKLQKEEPYSSKNQFLEQKDYIQVFNLNNKLSHYLPQFKVPTRIQNQSFWIKLCIPFPKVQPPQIYPTFDYQMIQQIDVSNVQTKPQAPWIRRQQNSIKFTDKIQVFSRLQMQKSQASKHIKRQTLMRDLDHENQYGQGSLDGQSFQESMIAGNIRQKLKLDAGIQQKLNKILKKEK